MRKYIFFKSSFAVLIILTTIIYSGCENKPGKSEKPRDEIKTKVVTPDKPSGDINTGENKPVVETKISIPDIKGKWTGTFDGRATVLNITVQTDSNFSGKISINYRQPINQEVKGSFSPTTMKMIMTDQLHSRYQGKYNGNLSVDADNYSGTFTMDVDGSKFSFNLNKGK